MSDTKTISLDDKYRLQAGTALVAGRQALVRIPLAQRALDRRAGLDTAGYISGYRGSPLGGFDAELWKVKDLLEANDILFQPGLNEDLALTAVAGTQQVGLIPGGKVDGVFGIWYAKGPGVDRSGDSIKHANLTGTSSTGGVLLAFGDDQAGKSSTTAHQSDLTLASWEVPILYPSNVAEIFEYGLAGIAMSRFSGALVGLKLVNETAEGTGILHFEDLPSFVLPSLPDLAGDVHIRSERLSMLAQDARVLRKLPRAQAFARANRIDRIAYGSDRPRFVVAAAGKTYPDSVAALAMLGLGEEAARRVGIGIYKIGLLFPLDPVALSDAVAAAEEVFFVEEKRAHAETQAKALLYHHPGRPRVTGKADMDGVPLLPSDIPFDVTLVAAHLAARLEAIIPDIAARVPGFGEAASRLRAALAGRMPQAPIAARRPAFCPGCPHNSSTRLPDGALGGSGIGCHSMVVLQSDHYPLPMSHMGGEGASWIGLSNFTERPHIFQNLGDGTYSHSGSLAIRAAVAAGTKITYKILYNDAVAMTGGQPVEGSLTVGRIVRQMQAEGVSRLVVLSDDPGRFAEGDPLPPGTELRSRDDLAQVQEELSRQPGVSILLFDQVCAAEKRRRRKVGAFPDPDRRIFINAAVCEGCGDCSVQSNCLAIQPLETELGRKRRIDQSACNKDFSCLKGFCPSFTIVEGAQPRRSRGIADIGAALPEPDLPTIGDGFDMIVTGVGGTGIITVSAILGMAARIENLGASLYDMTGLSQKGGAVFSHVRLRPDRNAVVPPRIGPAEADLILACDLIAAVHPEIAETAAAGKTLVVGNSDTMATADFQFQRDLQVPQADLIAKLATMAGRPPALLPAASLSQELLGDSIAANVLMLGFAWQRGAVPLTRASIERAIELNGRNAKANLRAFAAGRQAAIEDREVVPKADTLDAFIARRTADLAAYWNRAYADRYVRLMADIRAAAARVEGGDAFAEAVARSAYKLMAYKDEYEVARLYSDGRFRAALDAQFENTGKLKVQLSPPIFAKVDPVTGRPRKMSFGGWIFLAFRVLAAARALREGPFDLFGRAEERRLERRLRDLFLERIADAASRLDAETLPQAIALAQEPLQVRGFGFVKRPSMEALIAKLEALDAPA
ncbi:indolepyruvate ferredoxin oxidoreductase family protein [Sphingosinicella rhizophila]|uniref:Indolepyruvate ferredoxin oxidoreductase family protein n=1 Tax=Sphingosinicella rhizophila TaxID=3050082 RepID=A0ABU3QB36_9SPHN|nr:indolepyruvate ferredoxin oxidoreductase family protein [Sphingosinicella sp. GR2756]MDT9600364.1 indolepyruvate ferredoxin oxidoreductase family protein [Sphingosinicella sp. GR2756]